MNEQPKWLVSEESVCMRKWTDYLHTEAKRLFLQDGTHGNLLFCFNKEDGLISVNPVPPKTDHHQLDAAIVNAVIDHNLFGVIVIGETWTYAIKDNDQLECHLMMLK